MSEKAPTEKAVGWSERDKLVYLFGLVEATNVKLNYDAAPRPSGKTVGACKIMVFRLKDSLKKDLDALKAGAGMTVTDSGTPKTPTTPKTRKRKAKDGDEVGSPKKKGRKTKVAEDTEKAEVAVATKDETNIKDEADLDDEFY